MAQEDGVTGGDAEGPASAGDEQPDAPENWGKNGLVGEGRYRLTRRLGRGGMADVFAAEDVRLGRTVAVKLLRPDLAEDHVAKARFTREAQSVAGLNHHAVVAVYDSGEEQVGGAMGAVPYIVMELVSGHTIRELLNEDEPQPVERALAIVSGVLEALAYSHRHGIVHRDIKPANVIITETGSVKVMDFGIARALHGVQNTMTQTGMVMGTPQYLSPEQALGKAVDTRSDLYAVGCLIYELLTQRPPFTGETPLSVVYQHVQDTPRLPSEVSALPPPELDGLVMRSLAKDPDDRFQSAEEMRSLVEYAQRMLETHGGHTNGLWNTGSVTADTPAMGTPAASADTPADATRLGPPMLLGGPDGEPDQRAGQGRDNRLKYLLIALLAVCAIGAGVLVAVNAGGGDDEPDVDPSPSETVETDEPEPDPDENDEEPEEEEPGSTDELPWDNNTPQDPPPEYGNNGNNGNNGNPTNPGDGDDTGNGDDAGGDDSGDGDDTGDNDDTAPGDDGPTETPGPGDNGPDGGNTPPPGEGNPDGGDTAPGDGGPEGGDPPPDDGVLAGVGG